MKYKLTQEAIEELKAMEFEDGSPYQCCDELAQNLEHWYMDNKDAKVVEPITIKLPKPRLKSIEDLKALEGWELIYTEDLRGDCIEIDWETSLDLLRSNKIRQIDMPENEYLVSDCIEQEIEEPNIWKGAYKEPKEPISLADYQAHKDREFEAKVREIIKKVLKEEAGE